jgi:polysaccharide export outer membrane protein
MPTKFAVLGLALLLAACGNLPRGSGIEREVLAHGNDTVAGTETADQPGVPSEFAVEVLSRENLVRYAKWPSVGITSMPWIKRVAQPNNRIIAPGDSVAIVLWSTEENSLLGGPNQRVVTLPPMQLSGSGQVFLPYIGQIKLSGMSPEHARSAIESAYAAVVPSTQVQLALTEGRQSTVSAVDGLVHPGPFPLPDQNMTVLDLVAQAGGVAPNIVNPQIRLQRGNRTYGTALSRLLEDTAMNTTLVGGDRVFVEDDDRYFLSLGAASTRAQHRFPQAEVTALGALSLIGGLAADRANARSILILRTYPQSAVRRDGKGPRHARTIFTVDLTNADGLFSAGQFQINTGDLIYVTESPLIGTRNVFGVIGSVFGLTNQANSVANALNN